MCFSFCLRVVVSALGGGTESEWIPLELNTTLSFTFRTFFFFSFLFCVVNRFETSCVLVGVCMWCVGFGLGLVDLMEDAVRRKEKPGRVYSRLSLSLYLDLYGVDPDTRDETKIDDYVPDEFIRAFVHFVRNFHPFFSLPPRPVYTSLKDRV